MWLAASPLNKSQDIHKKKGGERGPREWEVSLVGKHHLNQTVIVDLLYGSNKIFLSLDKRGLRLFWMTQATCKSQCSGFSVEAQEVSGDGPDGADRNPPSPCWPNDHSNTHTYTHTHTHTHTQLDNSRAYKSSHWLPAVAALSLQYER